MVMNQEELRVARWQVLRKINSKFPSWLAEQSGNHIFDRLEFLPHTEFLEAYIFYKFDMDISSAEHSGFTESIKRTIIAYLNEFQYPMLNNSRISFVFDSRENVIKNYKGIYSLRLQ